ncbi:dephospho-CoA kinase [Limosilactobacillus sp.]|uniref:dephospho-CoA kinase n=1 Tax=Limosilactobacillus sp. TaxID=2773925 RepID=UPI00345E92D7
MKVIGLTGGIASGKSTVSRQFGDAGWRIVDADKVAHQLTAADGKAIPQITGAFGNDVLLPDGSLNRRALGQLVFARPRQLATLNEIMQPLIRQSINQNFADAQREGRSHVILDAPTLFEQGYQGDCDQIVVVSVDPTTQLQRLIARDSLSQEQAQQRIASQMSLAKKRELANWVIDNSGDRQFTRQQAAWLIDHLNMV